MTDPLFLHPLDPFPAVGARVLLEGAEGHHAATVRRLRAGESVLLADGRGRGVRGRVLGAGQDALTVEVTEVVQDTRPPWRLSVVQALPKGERAELAVEVLTEIGVDEIVPWQASRSIVRWQGERGERSRARWQGAAREAAKQCRRFSIPTVTAAVDTAALCRRLASVDQVLLLHEEAPERLTGCSPAPGGSLTVVVGPEGGISDEERSVLEAAGARSVRLGDTVLRTSTAGVVAVAQLLAITRP